MSEQKSPRNEAGVEIIKGDDSTENRGFLDPVVEQQIGISINMLQEIEELRRRLVTANEKIIKDYNILVDAVNSLTQEVESTRMAIAMERQRRMQQA